MHWFKNCLLQTFLNELLPSHKEAQPAGWEWEIHSVWGPDHRIIMAWVAKDHHLISTPLPWAGLPTTRPGCPEPHPALPWLPPGIGHLQPNLSGQPVPVCHYPLSEKLPPNIKPKPPLSQFKTILPVLSLSTLVNRYFSSTECSTLCEVAWHRLWSLKFSFPLLAMNKRGSKHNFHVLALIELTTSRDEMLFQCLHWPRSYTNSELRARNQSSAC